MSEQEKLALLEECMELEAGTLKADDRLDDYDEWDSLTALALIAMLDEKFHKTLTGQDIKKMETVRDVLAVIG